MNRSELWLLILCMAAVTYIPRALPAVIVEKLRFTPRMEKFLQLIPYTAMAAMIFPGIWTTDPANPLIGIAGGLTAALLAWRKCPIMVTVLGAIAADFLLYLIV